jgi:hypothetical protein
MNVETYYLEDRLSQGIDVAFYRLILKVPPSQGEKNREISDQV